MIRPHLLSLCLLSFALSVPAAWGQGYSLDRCISTGLASNADLQRSRHDVERARGAKVQAFGQFLPDLNASGSWSRSDQDVIYFRGQVPYTSRNSFTYSIGSNLTLFDGLGTIYTVDRGILAQKASEFTLDRTRQDLVFAIQSQFYTVLRLRELIQVQKSNIERSRKQLVRVREMYAVGSSPQADVFRQEVQVGRDELALLQAEGNYRDALVDLQTLIGLVPDESFAVDDAGIVTRLSAGEMDGYRKDLGDFPALVRNALELRADCRSAALQVEGQQKSVAIARAGYFPNLSAFARYGWSNLELRDFNEYDRFTYGLSVSLPIFNNFSTRTAVERAEYDALDAENTRLQLERRVAGEIRKALNALATAEKNVDIATRTLASAREDQRIASERYSLGAGTLLDVLVGTANQTSAEADLVNATFSYLVARKQLDHTLGK